MQKTIADIQNGLWPSGNLAQFASWPPDLFALAATLLSDSGAYFRVVSPPNGNKWPVWDGWAETVRAKSQELVRFAAAALVSDGEPPQLPGFLAATFEALEKVSDTPVAELTRDTHWETIASILDLHAIADEACAGLGQELSPAPPSIAFAAAQRLKNEGTLARISPDRARVVPKQRTPLSGITLQSLSRYVALTRCEVKPRWYMWPWKKAQDEGVGDRLSMLLVPWPIQIRPNDFRPVPGPLINMDPDDFGFFEYNPTQEFAPGYVERAIAAAKEQVQRVDAVILPEGALVSSDIESLQTILNREGVPLLIAGVREPATKAPAMGRNYAHIGLDTSLDDNIPVWVTASQHKHHRWCLDKGQIYNYHIGAALHPTKRWWEAIQISDRQLGFVVVGRGLTICPLICEDLARQAPVADLIRAVGPTLVVALLLDGPQLSMRWPARYASVLADEPGSSVLSLSSLGMVERSRPHGRAPTRVIALWKDRARDSVEIALDPRSQAVLLTACTERRTGWTADGRSDRSGTIDLILSDIMQIAFSWPP